MNGQGVTQNQVRSHLKQMLTYNNLDPTTHCFHTFGRSGVTLAFNNGVDISHIKRHGTWLSDAYLYCRRPTECSYSIYYLLHGYCTSWVWWFMCIYYFNVISVKSNLKGQVHDLSSFSNDFKCKCLDLSLLAAIYNYLLHNVIMGTC